MEAPTDCSPSSCRDFASRSSSATRRITKHSRPPSGSVHITLPSMAGAFSIVLFSLLMRIYDEMKDAEADIRLGRAGDPRYKDRPIVTGAVTMDDLVVLRWMTTALLIVINAPLGQWPLIGFAVLFLVTWLSFKWFFWPSIALEGTPPTQIMQSHNPKGVSSARPQERTFASRISCYNIQKYSSM